MKPASALPLLPLVSVLALAASSPAAVDLARDGQATAAIWHYAAAPEPKAAGRRGATVTDATAAQELAKYLQQITGAAFEIKAVAKGTPPEAGKPAVVLGQMALDLGLAAPPQTISGDGYRILTKDRLLLMAGETPTSTSFAVSHLLETLGCRWYFDNPIGEVVPELKTVSVDTLDIAEKPDFAIRRMWGPNWNSEMWGRRNRLGGLPANTGHDWQHVPPAKYAEAHPEYYALRAGARKPGGWVCTTNPDVIRLFVEGVAAEAGDRPHASVSISPPDGTGYCECDACKALDEPTNIEASSGRVAMSDRYMTFFNAVGAGVLKINPNAVLNFYAYADYSIPPKRPMKSPENLCAWVAPLRFCRLHPLGSPICESRRRCKDVVEGWCNVVSKMGWREYNYQVAELTVPFSKVNVWRQDIPYLKKRGCVGLNIECLATWHIYGPHTWLVSRMMWKTDLDVDATMNDFYLRFCGKAAPHVKAYWERIDKAVATSPAHSGSFYSNHVIWSPELLAACTADLDAAARAADTDLARKRVGMFRMGLENARFFLAVRDATNRCDFAAAKDTLTKWQAHMDAVFAERVHPIGEYKQGYTKRFLAPAIDQGFARTTGNCKLLTQLPDEWLFRYDTRDEGETAGWQKPGATAEGWRKVNTCSATLSQQGIPEELTYLWYRVAFTPPAQLPQGPLTLWFAEIDGRPTKVFLNGEQIAEFAKGRIPNEVEVTGKLIPGRENVIAVKIDHRSITELLLGGIIKPVMIYSGQPPAPEPAPAPPAPPAKTPAGKGGK
jgi:hypothetical protein